MPIDPDSDFEAEQLMRELEPREEPEEWELRKMRQLLVQDELEAAERLLAIALADAIKAELLKLSKSAARTAKKGRRK